MKQFLHVSDIGDLGKALEEAKQVKATPFAWQNLGKNKTIILIFFNNSLRTRLSSQKAALNLGMNPIVLNINGDSWKLETQLGVVMDGDKSEHLREAIPVIGSYCDIIGVRSFAGLKDKDFDYNETILNQFIEYSGRPVISLESGTVHPCQAFADLLTIEEHKKTFVITQPEGYELDPRFVGNAKVEYDQIKALEGADFVYAKNWSSVSHYGQVLNVDRSWTVGAKQMAVTNNAFFMHCLPVRRNMIVADEVIDSPQSLVIPEAANRVVSAQVVMKRMLESL